VADVPGGLSLTPPRETKKKTKKIIGTYFVLILFQHNRIFILLSTSRDRHIYTDFLDLQINWQLLLAEVFRKYNVAF
jgi:hypothetical protein